MLQHFFVLTSFALGVSVFAKITLPLQRTPIEFREDLNDDTNVHFKNGFLKNSGRQFNSLKSLKEEQDFYNADNFAYLAEVKIGTPPQPFLLQFDTGSTDMWVYSNRCWWSLACWTHRYFKQRKSSTFEDLGKKVSISYLKGKVQGISGKDFVSFGNTQVAGQKFISATSVSYDLHTAKFDGILGLAFPKVSVIKGMSPLMNMFNQGLIEEPIMSVFLNRNKVGEHGGELVIGGTNEDIYVKGSAKPILVDKNAGAWSVHVGSVSIGGLHVFNYSEPGYLAIVDTGCSFTLLPKSLYDLLYKFVESHMNKNEFDCSKIEQLPPLTLNIEYQDYTIPGKNLVYHDKEKGFCLFSFTEGPENVFILGDNFIANFYSVFNFSNGHETVTFNKLKTSIDDE